MSYKKENSLMSENRTDRLVNLNFFFFFFIFYTNWTSLTTSSGMSIFSFGEMYGIYLRNISAVCLLFFKDFWNAATFYLLSHQSMKRKKKMYAFHWQLLCLDWFLVFEKERSLVAPANPKINYIGAFCGCCSFWKSY